MPKRARQAHIPQQIRRRKPRRPGMFGADTEGVGQTGASNGNESGDAGVIELHRPVAPAVEARPHRRLESLTRSRESAMPLRVVPGQLPIFERSFLVNELKRISITAGALLAMIIVLTFVLR